MTPRRIATDNVTQRAGCRAVAQLPNAEDPTSAWEAVQPVLRYTTGRG